MGNKNARNKNNNNNNDNNASSDSAEEQRKKLTERQILDLISNPENSTGLEELFNAFDTNKNGALEKDEWLAFGKYLWEVDVQDSLDKGEKDVRNLSRSTPLILEEKIENEGGIIKRVKGSRYLVNVPSFCQSPRPPRPLPITPSWSRKLSSRFLLYYQG